MRPVDQAMTIGSLFSGIGGLDLGLERAGLGPVVWQVERDEYCRSVLARHWNKAERFDDVRTVGKQNLKRVRVMCGGFPCQDISYAGPGAGISGERSGLWFEYARIIGELRPQFVVVENVAALLDRGGRDVLGTLAALGFDAEWSVVSACSLGATHVRRRLFVVAYTNGVDGWPRLRNPPARSRWAVQTGDRFASARARAKSRVENPSELYRGADGVPYRMERNRAIGNAVAPDCGELVGELIARAA